MEKYWECEHKELTLIASTALAIQLSLIGWSNDISKFWEGDIDP